MRVLYADGITIKMRAWTARRDGSYTTTGKAISAEGTEFRFSAHTEYFAGGSVTVELNGKRVHCVSVVDAIVQLLGE